MSGLEGLGIACNIMQLISFTAETVKLCHLVYEGQAPEKEMLENATALQTLIASIDPDASAAKTRRSVSEQDLIDMARRCKVAAKEVVEEVSFLMKGHKQGSLASTLKVAAKTNWRTRRLKRLEQNSKRYQDTLEAHMLVRIW